MLSAGTGRGRGAAGASRAGVSWRCRSGAGSSGRLELAGCGAAGALSGRRAGAASWAAGAEVGLWMAALSGLTPSGLGMVGPAPGVPAAPSERIAELAPVLSERLLTEAGALLSGRLLKVAGLGAALSERVLKAAGLLLAPSEALKLEEGLSRPRKTEPVLSPRLLIEAGVVPLLRLSLPRLKLEVPLPREPSLRLLRLLEPRPELELEPKELMEPVEEELPRLVLLPRLPGLPADFDMELPMLLSLLQALAPGLKPLTVPEPVLQLLKELPTLVAASLMPVQALPATLEIPWPTLPAALLMVL